MSRREYRRNDVNPATPCPDKRNVAPPAVPLPGGRVNVLREAEDQQVPPVPPAGPYFTGIMAHGVEPKPGEHRPVHHSERSARSATALVDLPVEPVREQPVLVSVVPLAAGNRPLSKASYSRIPVPAPGNQPVPLAGRDLHRLGLQLLNESAVIIRLVEAPTAQVSPGGNGAALPASMTSYQRIQTQEAVYAVADSGAATVYVSVINEYSVPGGA